MHEFDGRKYEKASAHQKEWGTAVIAGLTLRGDERVLDLGCGDGLLTARIAELVPDGEVVGIDASQGMIEVAREKEGRNLRFILKDIESLDFVGEFDLVFSNAALHWVKDHRTMLQNVRRSLREGGEVRFNFAGDGNCANFFRVVRGAMEEPEFRSYFDGFEWPWFMPSLAEYDSLAGQAGMTDVKVWEENADRHFPDAHAMVKWVDQPSLVPFVARVAEADRKAFRDAVVARMIEETRQPDGRCFETFRRINLSARK